jgi:hypothetical protein
MSVDKRTGKNSELVSGKNKFELSAVQGSRANNKKKNIT